MSKSVQMATSSPSKHENAKHNLGFEANNRGVWLHAKNEAVATVRYAIASKKCRKQNQQNLFEETILKITSPFFCTKSQSYIDSWTQNDSKKNEKYHSYIGLKTMKTLRNDIHFFSRALNCPIANPAPRCWGYVI